MPEQDFDKVNIFSGEMTPKEPSAPAVQSGLVSVEQSRAMAEVQAAMIIARGNPRDEFTAYEKIKKACRRKSLAETAAYAYPRGGKMVTGPTIRLAEVLACHWGNLTYGLKELSRKLGSSEVEAFAWDLETNTRVIRTFVVNHIRDKQSGNVALTSERDVYELVANMGQRRVRACILELIPGDIVEAAEKQCKETLLKDEKPIEDRIREMVVAFSDLGVTQEMLEARLGHKLKGVVPAQLVQLTQIHKSLKDGVAKREDFFSLTEKGKGQELLSIEEKFFNEFLYNKHTATKQKINNAVGFIFETTGSSEEEIKKNALLDPDDFRQKAEEIAKASNESLEKDKAPEEDVTTMEPSDSEKKVIEAKELLAGVPEEQLMEFMVSSSFQTQLGKMPLDDQSKVREYYSELIGK